MRLFFIFLLLAGPTALFAQNRVQQEVPAKTRILFVLDGSGSMEARWDSQQSRMDIAKSILTKLVDSLRINPDLELGLRVYGHQYARPQNNCEDSKLEVPFAARNHDAIIGKIKGIIPRGVTPITYSLSQAANDFPSAGGYRNILILITDGVESCGGDPCSVSLELQKKGVFLRPYVIGLGLKAGTALECLGKYIDSEDASSFNKVLNQSIKVSLAKTTVSVELLDGAGRKTEKDVTVSFRNSITNAPLYEFIHYRDDRGRPDSVTIDPVPTYDIVVQTVPAVVVRNAAIEPGQHNVVEVAVPQGSLTGIAEGRGNSFSFVVRQKGKGEILNQQQSGTAFRYLQGEYEVETLTLPRRVISIKIEADKSSSFSLPGPGLVNINTLTKGIGTLLEELPDGSTRWVCHLSDNSSLHSYRLLPGKYRVAFRVKQAAGSKYTGVKSFEVKTGETVNVKMF